MIVNRDTLIEALLPHVEAGKTDFKCFCAIKDLLPEGVKREVVDKEVARLRGMIDKTETDYGRFAWEDYKARVHFTNKLAELVAAKANEIIAEAAELEEKALGDIKEYRACRAKVVEKLKDVDHIQSLLQSGDIADPDRVKALLDVLDGPPELVATAEELFGGVE